jgi:hypothetical protein
MSALDVQMYVHWHNPFYIITYSSACVIPTKDHPSYQAIFQMHWDSRILLNYPPLERSPLLSDHLPDALQASTLTFLLTCPFGQLTKKSTGRTHSFSYPKFFFLLKMIKTRELLSAICVKCFGYCLTNMISLYQIFGLVKIPFSPDRTEFHRTEKISSFSCSDCFQPRATNFPFLVLVMQINCIYIFFWTFFAKTSLLWSKHFVEFYIYSK